MPYWHMLRREPQRSISLREGECECKGKCKCECECEGKGKGKGKGTVGCLRYFLLEALLLASGKSDRG